jgi:NAD-dependent dihydropyrimidine dehydrogenase PreA subunit
MWFKAYHEFGHGKTLDVSNYRAISNSETCKGCGLCTKRCPMDAIVLEASDKAKNKLGKISVIAPDLCIGCGVCAYKCPTESIALERRDEITEPPIDTQEFVGRFLRDLADPLPRREK